MNLSKKISLAIFLPIILFSCSSLDMEPVEQNQVEKEYKGNLDIVLGDIKRAFGQESLTTNAQLDNLIKGFKYGFKVDGVRVPIFPRGTMKPEQRILLHYFVAKCKAENLKIFANPIGHKGGVCIANGARDDFSSVTGDFSKSDTLIQVVKDFSAEYAVDFISPFNEDARPDQNQWTAEQIDDIYANLYGQVNGAKLVGSDAWGIPQGILFLDETDMLQYIDVSTTHNLGFNHGRWPEFITKSNGLPVWDSETTMGTKTGDQTTRIEAAIDNGVNGLVLYNTWKMIDTNTGEINETGLAYRDFYLAE